MPYVHLAIAGGPFSEEELDALHRRLLDLMVDILGKKRQLTSIVIEQRTRDAWRIGGAEPAVKAHLEANVTEGTNSAENKAAFVEAAFTRLRSVLGDQLAEATYVIVREIPADAWGFGGRTQKARATA